MSNTILEVEGLKKYFPVKKNTVGAKASYLKAVDDVSFTIEKGKTLGLIGESGCGKSTVAKLVNRLIEPTSGEVRFNGSVINKLNKAELKDIRKNVQMVFQDPYSSLDPRKTAGYAIEEPLIINKIGSSRERKEKVRELLKMVGLDYYHENRYPHECSGGQRQRINIARAIALNPELVICDEPVSALDVSIQAQVINLLKKLQQDLGLTYLFISHDLSVVKYLSDSLAIMYLGKIMEIGKAEDIYLSPIHPYTQALFSAIPTESPINKRERIILEGDVPSPLNPPKGCRFHTRCKYCIDICKSETPTLKEIGNGHSIACHVFPR